MEERAKPVLSFTSGSLMSRVGVFVSAMLCSWQRGPFRGEDTLNLVEVRSLGAATGTSGPSLGISVDLDRAVPDKWRRYPASTRENRSHDLGSVEPRSEGVPHS